MDPSPSSSHDDRGTALGRASYFLLGAGLLAPWNALLTAPDYYSVVFPASHVDRTLTLCYLPTCLLFLLLTTFFPHFFPRPYARVWFSYVAFSVMMAALALAEAFLPPAVGRQAAITALVGVFDGVAQGAVFGGAAGSMPPSFLHATVGGTSASGLLICLLRMATKATFPATAKGLRESVCLYFGVAALITAACVGAYVFVLPRLPVVRRHLADEQRRERLGRERARRRALGLQEEEGGGRAVAAVVAAAAEALGQQQQPLDGRREFGPSLSSGGGGGAISAPRASAAELEMSPKDAPSSANGSSDAAPLLLRSPLSSAGPPVPPPTPRLPFLAALPPAPSFADAPPPPPPSLALAKRALVPCVALACVYVVSLAIFPGVLGEDLKDAKLGGWYPLVLFTVYNLGDLSGKNLPLTRWVERTATDRVLLAASLARAPVFFPLYVAARTTHARPWAVALLTFALGLTNGYLTAALQTLAPRRLAEQEQRASSGGAGGGSGGIEEGRGDDDGGGCEAEAIENLLVIALVTGLLLGAMASWLWVV